MINKYVAMGLGALIALAPIAAVAQEQVAQAAPSSRHAPRHGHRDIRDRIAAMSAARAPLAGHRARASAHHMHRCTPPRRYRGSEELIAQSRARDGRERND